MVVRLRPGDNITASAMAPESECEHEMFVQVQWKGRKFAVPLGQIEVRITRTVDNTTEQVIADWHYWLDRGYQL